MDVPAIEAAYRAHGHSVLRRAQRILGDRGEAEEVLQDVFASLLGRPEQFEGRSALMTWLYSATTHRCLNLIRNQRTRAKLVALRSDPLPPTANPEQSAEARKILARVPEDLASVAIYYYFDQLTHAEIAELVPCSRRQVGNLLERFHQAAKGEEVR
jgi:RNA polymerase sigma-70 factor (ECF subfamily)